MQDAFVLWDTYGFPLDLTQVLRSLVFISESLCCFLITFVRGFQLMAEERGLVVDVDGFNKAMEEARERSRSVQNKVFQLFFYFLLKEYLMLNLTWDYRRSLDLHYILTYILMSIFGSKLVVPSL